MAILGQLASGRVWLWPAMGTMCNEATETHTSAVCNSSAARRVHHCSRTYKTWWLHILAILDDSTPYTGHSYRFVSINKFEATRLWPFRLLDESNWLYCRTAAKMVRHGEIFTELRSRKRCIG